MSAKPSRGLSTQSSLTAEVASGNSPRPSILRSAEIMASGFLVNSTEPASARNSRDRDSASLTSCDSAQATTISTTASTIISPAAPPLPPFRPLLPPPLLLDDEDDDEDDQDDPPP